MEVGGPLDEAGLEVILKKCGDPLLVAEHFLPQQSLIGPVLFPIYWFVLKMVLFGYLVPWLLVWICLLIFDPAYRAANPGLSQISNLSTLWSITVNSFFFITLGFATARTLSPEELADEGLESAQIACRSRPQPDSACECAGGTGLWHPLHRFVDKPFVGKDRIYIQFSAHHPGTGMDLFLLGAPIPGTDWYCFFYRQSFPPVLD